jgi:hypothetical protein
MTSQLSHHFVNTRYFREAAIAYKKNGGRYTLAPIESKEWYEFWEEQERRCLYGYKVGGVKVTGRHYFYMNFTQLRKIDEKNKGKKVSYKDWDFPSFFEIDYDWFWYKEIAWHGCNKAVLDKLKLWRNPSPNVDPITKKVLDEYGGAMHLGCLKTRRAGFSFKEGADGVYNYNFIPGSKSYYFAAIEQYLTTDGILNKVEYNLEFLNQNTDGWWLKNRMQKSTLMHQKASFIDDEKQVKGFLSEIIGVIINDPDKVRGKEGIKIVYEEAGSFKDLKRALAISVPSVSEGATLTGQISVFGTGGEEKGVDINGLEEIFNNPRTHRMLAFENDWEEGYEGSECGVFIPCYMANGSFMDNDGNVNKEKAIAFEDEQRELKRQSKDPRDYDLRIAENPKVPSEALLRITTTDFPQAEILLQTNRVLRSKEIQGLLLHGEIKNNPGKGLEFFVKENAKPVINYPHKDSDDIRGCITMVERPLTAKIYKNNKVITAIPDDVYIVVVDPYYKDEPKGKQSTISLGAVYVVKQTSIYFNNKTEQDVAWFVGRPGRTNELHEIIMNLAEFYNAKIQCEIAGGGQGLIDYARERKKQGRLMFEPIYINEKEVEKISKNRSFFLDLDTDKKREGIQYLSDYLKKVVGLDENGHEIWNLHYIYDLGYLQELKSFNADGNFDRISAQIVKMFTLKERIQEKAKKKEKKPNTGIFGKRPLFQDSNKSGQDKFLMLNDLM